MDEMNEQVGSYYHVVRDGRLCVSATYRENGKLLAGRLLIDWGERN
jgi:hypothetical protein